MKYYPWILLLGLVLSCNASALQSTTGLFEQFGDFRLVVYVEDQDIVSSPPWNPDSDALPLSVTEAIQALKDFNRNLDSSNSIVEIDLRPVPNYEEFWHYLIEVRDDDMSNNFSVFVVLMSGKVIPAIIEPEA